MHDCIYILTIFYNFSTSRMGFPPLGGRTPILRWWDLPYSKNHVCTLLDKMCPRVEVLTQISLWPFLGLPAGTDILRGGISLA